MMVEVVEIINGVKEGRVVNPGPNLNQVPKMTDAQIITELRSVLELFIERSDDYWGTRAVLRRAEDLLKALGGRKGNTLHLDANNLVDAWESLRGGRNYRPSEIQTWLVDKMAPAIDHLRTALGRERPSG